MKSYEREKNNPRQMIRKDGKGTFVEFILPTPDFNKVCVNGVKYDPQTRKQISLITIYYDIAEFTALLKKMELGHVARAVEQEKARMAADPSITYSNQLFKVQGGTKNDKTGSIVARNFFISPATKSKSANLMLNFERGVGYETENGLFNIDYKKGGIDRIQVPLNYDDLMEIATICQIRLTAYYTARQIRGDFDDYKKTATNDGTEAGTPLTPSTPEQAIVGGMQVVDRIDDFY